MATGRNAVCLWISAVIIGAAVDIDLIGMLTARVLPHSFRAHVEVEEDLD